MIKIISVLFILFSYTAFAQNGGLSTGLTPGETPPQIQPLKIDPSPHVPEFEKPNFEARTKSEEKSPSNNDFLEKNMKEVENTSNEWKNHSAPTELNSDQIKEYNLNQNDRTSKADTQNQMLILAVVLLTIVLVVVLLWKIKVTDVRTSR